MGAEEGAHARKGKDYMTSEEIRKFEIYDFTNRQSAEPLIRDAVEMLREIAAQLAQLNEGLASLTQPGGPQLNARVTQEAPCKH
jgi:hypothetical protein